MGDKPIWSLAHTGYMPSILVQPGEDCVIENNHIESPTITNSSDSPGRITCQIERKLWNELEGPVRRIYGVYGIFSTRV